MDRRRWLATLGATGVGASLSWWSPMARAVQWLAPTQPFIDTAGLRPDATSGSARVFDLSVASADPTETGVILWTHLNPAAVRPTEALWLQVALDASFATPLLQARIDPQEVSADRDHTVRIDLDGQLPATASGGPYFYRFIYAGVVSRTGRCRTLPARNTALRQLKLGLLTCQDFTNGYYGALAQLAQDDTLDFVLHLGDFIYETAGDPSFQSLPFADRTLVLPSGGIVSLGLADYRFIYRSYRADAHMQAAMEAHTFICVPDDHETANDSYWDAARDTLGAPDHPFTTDPQYGNDPARLRQLKLDSQRAWAEYVPARVNYNPLATHPHQALTGHRRFTFGSFLDLFMIETRTHRSPHPCGEGLAGQRYVPLGCTQAASSQQTLLGAAQRQWLFEGLTQSKATWKLMGNQVLLSRLALTFLGAQIAPVTVDGWDGYSAERLALMNALREAKVRNFLVATGDLHTHIASHVKVNYGNSNPLDVGNFVGVEFMTPAVTSANLAEMLGSKLTPAQRQALVAGLATPAVRLNNPHIQVFNSVTQGYSTLELTDSFAEWTSYAIDKSNNSAQASRRCIARQRKYMALPWLSSMPTWGV